MIKIITDTASDITVEQAKDMGVELLSLAVSFGETQYDQLADNDFTKFYSMLEDSSELPVTSLASPGDYLGYFEAAKRDGDSVVVIPISSELSGSYQSACIAREMADYADIFVVDARQALIGQRLVVEHAVKLRDEGKTATEIATSAAKLSLRIRLYGALDTLKYLIKGGRISKSVGIVGSAIGIKPIVCLENGAVVMAGKARGRNGAMEFMLNVLGGAKRDTAYPFSFGYTQNRQQLDEFLEHVDGRLDLADSTAYPVGGVIGTHVGPNAMVAVWVDEE